MTNDQQFIVALLTVVVPSLLSALTYRQSRSTHTAVNGILAKNTRRARAQGRAQGRADSAQPHAVPGVDTIPPQGI